MDSLSILLVEDNELDARSMMRHLQSDERTSFHVRHCMDLQTALGVLDEEGFDCVLLDLSLPDSAGLASVQTIVDRAPKSPIVVLTGLEDPDIALDAVQRGAQDYLTKQRVDAELVTRAIRYAVARHESEAQLRAAHEMVFKMQDRERIGRDLHDTVIGQLFATGMSLQASMNRTSDAELRTKLTSAVSGIDDAIHQLRQAVFGLHDQSSSSITDEIVDLIAVEHAALGFEPAISLDTGLEIAPEVRPHLLAALRESLSNMAKYADATAAEVRLEASGDHIILCVIDNGVGIDLDAEVDVLGGNGLRNLRRRAEELSGSFRVAAGPGGGTSITWSARQV